MIASALLFPLAVYTYCTGYVTNPMHVRPGYACLATRYGARLKALQYRYQNARQEWRGGISVCDMLGKRSGAVLFRSDTAPLPPAGTPTTPPHPAKKSV